jgi:hypothetical protein
MERNAAANKMRMMGSLNLARNLRHREVRGNGVNPLLPKRRRLSSTAVADTPVSNEV